ncbi:alpha/beta fold hydrolase [Streptomyces fuscichromogenes]|uniref:alpha/beta fold hydrolase n=1 Tax=Streptomyces fuscichromogenes TaxID=1324013 RepID=UPI00382E7F56
MTEVTSAVVSAPGCDIHYDVRGSGPLLLVVQGGGGDASRTDDLVNLLTADYTVVTYDRRGLSRSRLAEPVDAVTPETNAEDAHLLLAELTDRPALVLGSSIGANIALHLALRHPGQVSTVVAHEPLVLGVLDEQARTDAARALAELEALYAAQGWPAAVRAMAVFNNIDLSVADVEPGVVLEPTSADQSDNIEFFIGKEVPQFRRNQFDGEMLDRLKASPARIVPAAGSASGPNWSWRCAQALAERLGTGLETFPGGHIGLKTHPRAFAARLREVLAG